MGGANDLRNFKNNADDFICSVIPGVSNLQVQYSPGKILMNMQAFRKIYIIIKYIRCTTSTDFIIFI